ncbi:MAG: aminopeptidase P family protein [Verrucomicrobia bacterium]|nr:aminopeptidase P family protein [Verrucomicrobiota bacterium]
MSIQVIQQQLKKEKIDGWLFYDFHGNNHIFREVLKVDPDEHITRRFFYWIPAVGEPVKIVHKIESHILKDLPGKRETYSQREELSRVLKRFIFGRVAMELSFTLPQLSLIDGGTVEFVKEQGVEIVSSAILIQTSLSILTEAQKESQREAGRILDQIVKEAFSYVKEKKELLEGDVQAFILKRMADFDCETNHPPIVARGPNSALPHYVPKNGGDLITERDFLLLDLWCKKREPNAVYGDITRVSAPKGASQKIYEVFSHVREAQKIAVRYIESHKKVRGADVDTAVRSYLESKGYKENIYHRLGHSIDSELHGRGANLDSFESFEERILLPNTCYSVEPALYFPGEFGLRLEHDILYLGEGRVEITGGVQDKI